MSNDSDGTDQTLARLKPTGQAEREPLPVEPTGKYEQPTSGGDVELGRGGMGRVLRLEDVHLRREVALKELHPSAGSSDGPIVEQLFIREAQVLARLEHPGVVPIYELGRRADGTPYYAMRRIRGRPLSTALRGCASLDDRLTLLPHLIDVAHTMGFAHARGVVHRDLKPDNVMVGPFGETLVVDWGLALVDGTEAEGQLAGTPAYMSPEQVNGLRLDARSDVWSMGVMLYELLAGAPPFSGGVTEVLNDVKSAPVPPIDKRQPGLPRPLVAVLERALSRTPGDRFADGEALAVALEGALRARAPRSVWLAAAGGLALIAAALFALSSRSTTFALEQQQTRAAAALVDARAAHGASLAAAAVAALRAKDAVTADRLAQAALGLGKNPLATGVRLLLAERGVPTRRWKTPVEAGCAHLAVTSSLVACSTLNGVELFDVVTGEAKGRLSAGPAAGWLPTVAALADDQIIAGADNRTLYRWALGGGAPETWSFPESITTVAPAAGGVVVGLRDGRVFFQGRDGARVERPRVPKRVKALAADGAQWAVAGDGVLRVSSDVTVSSTALALEYGAGGRLFAAVERSVLELDGKAQQVKLFSGHRDSVTAIAAGQRLAAGDADGAVRVFYDDGALEHEVGGFGPGVQALTWSTDDAVLVVAPRGRTLEGWSIPTTPKPLPDEGTPTFHAFWSRGWLLTGLKDGRIRKIDTTTRQVDFVESKHEGAVRVIAAAGPDERPSSPRHLSGGDDGQVLLQRWNGEVEVLDARPGRAVTALDVSGDGSRASWAFDDGTVVLWALNANAEVSRTREAVVRAIRFSPDARVVAFGRDDKRVVLVDAQDGRERGRLEETDAAVLAVRFANERVVTALANGHVVVWGPDRRPRATFTAATDRASALEVSPDGSMAVVGSDDGHVTVFSLEHGVLLADVPADAGQVLAVAFVGNDSIFAAGTDRQLHLWSLAPP